MITSSKVTRHAFKIPVILLIANLFKYVKYTEAADKKHVRNAFTGEVVGASGEIHDEFANDARRRMRLA